MRIARSRLACTFAGVLFAGVGCGGEEIDRSAPAPPEFATPPVDAYISSPVEITGTARPDASLRVRIYGLGRDLGHSFARADAQGAWTIRINYEEPDYGTAMWAIATQNVGGADSAEAQRAFRQNRSVPEQPVVTEPVASATVTSPFSVSGTAEAYGTVFISIHDAGGGPLGATSTPVDGASSWSTELTYTEPGAGAVLELRVHVANSAGASGDVTVMLQQGS